MKKGRILLLGIIVFGSSLIWLTVKYINLSNNYDQQQKSIDTTFISSLSLAESGFGSDLNYTPAYNEAMSNLASTSQLAWLTTYENKNDTLDVALDDLYKLMKEDKYKKAIIENSKLIYDSLLNLSQNPLDTEVTQNIWELAEKIRQENH